MKNLPLKHYPECNRISILKKDCLKFELKIDYVSYQHTSGGSKTATSTVGGGGAGALGSPKNRVGSS